MLISVDINQERGYLEDMNNTMVSGPFFAVEVRSSIGPSSFLVEHATDPGLWYQAKTKDEAAALCLDLNRKLHAVAR